MHYYVYEQSEYIAFNTAVGPREHSSAFRVRRFCADLLRCQNLGLSKWKVV